MLENDREIRNSLYIWGREKNKNGNWTEFCRMRPITFSKRIFKQKEREVKFVALGHPLVNKIIHFCTNPAFGGKATIKYDPMGREGILFVFRGKVFTGKGQTRGEKLFAIFYDKKTKSLEEVEPSSIWSFEDIKNPSRLQKVPIEFIDEAYVKAEGMAIKLLNELLNEVKEKVKREVAIKRNDVKRYYEYHINQLQRKIRTYKRPVFIINGKRFVMREGRLVEEDEKSIARTIGRMKADLKRLSEAMEEILSELEMEEVLAYDAPELIAAALILPRRLSRKEKTRLADVWEIEQAGISYVMNYEMSRGRKPTDVSTRFKGYDIVSEGPKEKRYIEVKAFKETGPLEITSHEWIVAEKLKEKYWLYIVEQALNPEKRTLYLIKNPSQTLQKIAEHKPILQFKVIVKQWKEQADIA